MDYYRTLLMIATEGFIRRSVATGKPFMLKGSYLTRQYYKDPSIRLAADLDWVYLRHIKTESEAEDTFNEWLNHVLNMEPTLIDDGVHFKCIREEKWWGLLEYSIRQDFPTVNMELSYQVNGVKTDRTRMDLSYNLNITDKPVSILYQPIMGEPFNIAKTASLAIQVSWKLHQTITYPRFKDIFDLIHILDHPSYDKQARNTTVEMLIKECIITREGKERISWLFTRQLDKLFFIKNDYYESIEREIELSWLYWRHDDKFIGMDSSRLLRHPYEVVQKTTSPENVPESLDAFLDQFYKALERAGLTIDLINEHPYMRSEG